MTPADWMDDLLDRHPGEPVPPGFHERLKARLADEPATQGPVLRPGFRRLLPMAAAAIVFLGIGFWLGRAGDPLGEDPGRPSEETVSIEEIDQLTRSVESFHLEGIRFRYFGLRRRLTTFDGPLPDGATDHLDHVGQALGAAGFQTGSS